MKAYEIINNINKKAALEGRKEIVNPNAYYMGSNEGYIIYHYTAEEQDMIIAAKLADKKEKEAKEKTEKNKQISPEQAAKKKAHTNARRYAREIEKCKKQITEIEKQIVEMEQKKVYWENLEK